MIRTIVVAGRSMDPLSRETQTCACVDMYIIYIYMYAYVYVKVPEALSQEQLWKGMPSSQAAPSICARRASPDGRGPRARAHLPLARMCQAVRRTVLGTKHT